MKGELPEDIERRVFKVPEAADILGVGRGTMYAAIKRGEVPSVRIGGRIVVPGVGILHLLQGGFDENGGPSPPK